jgi:hypothetical protein
MCLILMNRMRSRRIIPSQVSLVQNIVIRKVIIHRFFYLVDIMLNQEVSTPIWDACTTIGIIFTTKKLLVVNNRIRCSETLFFWVQQNRLWKIIREHEIEMLWRKFVNMLFIVVTGYPTTWVDTNPIHKLVPPLYTKIQ